MRGRCPVEMEERNLAFRVGHRLPVDEEGNNIYFPLSILAATSSLGVFHAPRFDGGDYSLVVLAAAFARHVLQLALVNANVIVALFRRAQVGFSDRYSSLLGRPIPTKHSDETRPFDEGDHIFGGRLTPKNRAPDPQQDCKRELDKIPGGVAIMRNKWEVCRV